MTTKYTKEEILSDNENYEYALSEAGWKYIEVFKEITYENISPRHFNNIKAILRETIKEYINNIDK